MSQSGPSDGQADVVDLETLRHLHVDDGLSARQVAARTHLSAYRVRALLTAHGWYHNPSSGGRPLAAVNESELRRLLIDEGLSSRQVAEQLRLSRAVVTRYAQRFRIAGAEPAPRSLAADSPTVEQLVELYVAERLTLRELAQRSGRSYVVTRRALEQAGVPVRRGARRRPRTSLPREELVEAVTASYEYPEASMVAVGQQVGVSVATVRRVLHATGTATRQRIVADEPLSDERTILLDDLLSDPQTSALLGEFGASQSRVATPDTPAAHRQHIVDPRLRDEAMRRLYVEGGLAAFHISLLLGLSPGYIRTHLKQMQVDIRPAGVLSPFERRRRQRRR